MNNTRIFLIEDSNNAEEYKRLFQEVERGLALPYNVAIHTNHGNALSPTSFKSMCYDGYLLYIPEINESNLQKLRQEQPWSWVYGTIEDKNKVPKSIESIFDKTFTSLSRTTFAGMLIEIGKYRGEK